jgi:CRISPR-associated endoribonuclease Cas6
MRLSIKLKPHSTFQLPLNYQQALQGFIYTILKDRNFAQFLHSQGYLKGKRTFKLITFSRLQGKYHIDRKAKKIVFDDEIEWQVSSVVPEFIQDFGQSLLTSSDLQLHGQPIHIEALNYTQPKIEKSNCRISMLSPITIYSTYEKENGKKITQYFSPEDAVFSHLIEENLKKKYEAYYGETKDDTFQIRPVQVSRKDKVITRFKGFIINAWGGTYEIQGSPEMIDFAHSVGLGGKNSQGFGMFEVSNDLTYKE